MITVEGKEYIIIATIWLLIGLLSVIIICVHDMRGEPYDGDYFKGEILHSICIIFMGGAAFLIIVFICTSDIFEKYMRNKKNNRKFTKFIYKIANIGIKKDGDKK